MPNLFSLLKGIRFCHALFMTVFVCLDAKKLEALNLLQYSAIDENGGLLGPPFPLVHNHLLWLGHVDDEVVVCAAHGQDSDLLHIGCLIVVGDQAYHCCVIRKVNDAVRVVPGRSVMSEQGVQEGSTVGLTVIDS